MPSLRPFDIVHVSSAHPWTDNRVHQRQARSAAEAGYRTALIAVAEAGERPDPDWSLPDRGTGVYVRRVRPRRRLARVLVGSAEAVRLALRSRARVVHLHDPELAWSVPVLRALGRRVVYDAHEDLPDQVRSKPYVRSWSKPLVIGAAHAVLSCARQAHTVVAATPVIAARFGRGPGHVVVVRNFPRVSDVAADTPTQERPLRAVYIGALSRVRGADVLGHVAAARRFPDGWVVTTAGRADEHARRVLASAGRAVDHRGVLHPTEAMELLGTARVGLIPLLPTPAHNGSIPTKLLEYMAAGLAVIATDIPTWRRLLEGVDCVTWVPAADPDAIVEAMRRYADDPELLTRHATAAARAARLAFHWELEERTLLAVYQGLFGARPELVLEDAE